MFCATAMSAERSMLASSRYSPAVPIKLAKHARQLNLFAMSTKEISRAEHVQPCFVEPMQVSAVRELPDGGFWTYEAKLDGVPLPCG